MRSALCFLLCFSAHCFSSEMSTNEINMTNRMLFHTCIDTAPAHVEKNKIYLFCGCYTDNLLAIMTTQDLEAMHIKRPAQSHIPKGTPDQLLNIQNKTRKVYMACEHELY